MTAVVVNIPGQPVPKGRPRFTRGGFAYTPDKTRKYEKLVAGLAKAALDACNGIIWRDDALICSLLVKKRYAAYPCLEIKVAPEEVALFGR